MSARSLLWRVMGTGARLGFVAGRATNRLSILIYHSVASDDGIVEHSDITEGAFTAQMNAIRHAFRVLPLSEAVGRLQSGDLPPGALSISFDDGYADNATRALPILQRFGLPATFFIATAYLDGGRMFNDALIEAMRRCPSSSIDLDRFGLGCYELTDAKSRRRAAERVLRALKYLDPTQRDAQTAAVVEAAGVVLKSRLMMSSEQVAMIAASGMEVGGHTHTHPILNSVTDAAARADILQGKRRLEAIVSKPVILFAYPNGQPGQDYSARHVTMVRDAGFLAAVSTARGVAERSADVHQIPRFTPWDRSPERFLARLILNASTTKYPVAA